MVSNKTKFFSTILSLVFLSIMIIEIQAELVLPQLPPVKPERFENYKQLKEYLVKCYEYYAIHGRPKFG
jgi:hypothetical protein